MIKEISDVKCGQLSVDGFSTDECEEILRYACTSQWMEPDENVPEGWID